MSRYSNDPRQTTSKFPSTCSKCGKPIEKGDTIYYWPSDKSATHEACGDDDFRKFVESAQDEDFLNSQFMQP